jgi:alkanesulfonate monooxygenase SsuD/methylene tetrahydromethanopterin reductase-like flavin-dependent oxidoreductase (luciferase family)
VRFGLLLPSELPPGHAPARRVDEVRALVRLARDAGFDSIWALHHFVSNVPTLQPLPLLAALAGDSGRMTIGTGILVLPLFEPVQVAEDAATLDAITGGRFVLGVGAGYWEPEFRALGVPPERRGARLEEMIGVIRSLWTGEPSAGSPRFEHVRGARQLLRPSRPGGPPIYVGGVSEHAIARAARVGDALLLPPDLDPPALGRKIAAYREAMAARGRRITVLPAQRECLLADTAQDARRAAEPYLRQNAAIYAERGMDWIERAFDRWFERAYLVGSAGEVAEQVGRLADLGITDLHLRIGWGDAPFDVMARTLEIAAERLLPLFAGQPSGVRGAQPVVAYDESRSAGADDTTSGGAP